MEGHDLVGRMNTVKAPEDFEAVVLGRLPAARQQRARARRAHARYAAFAGSAAVLIAAALLFNPGLPEKETVLTYAERAALAADPDGLSGGPSANRNRIFPVFEAMDYASEFRNAQAQPRTVYILEQVSEIPSSEIIY